MAFNKNELILDKVRSLVAHDLEDKKMLLSLDADEEEQPIQPQYLTNIHRIKHNLELMGKVIKLKENMLKNGKLERQSLQAINRIILTIANTLCNSQTNLCKEEFNKFMSNCVTMENGLIFS